MNVTDAQAAALPALLAAIAGLQQQVAIVDALCSDTTAAITGNVSVMSQESGNANLAFPPLTAAESAPFFAAMLSVLQARLTAAQAQLAAL